MAVLVGALVFATREAIVSLYTRDPAVAAVALSLLSLVALFHLGDALQTFTQFVLRAWRVTVVSLIVFALAMWGLGLGGGYLLAFDVWGVTPPSWRGAPGFWLASTAGLWCAGLALSAFLAWMQQLRTRGLAEVDVAGSARPAT